MLTVWILINSRWTTGVLFTVHLLWLIGVILYSTLSPNTQEYIGFRPVRLAYNTFESSLGTDDSLTPVIFIHGISDSKEVWNNIPQTIADETRRKVYAYDARNHGDSEQTEEFSFDANVDDLFYFMETINATKAILVGHSMGGLTATNAALRQPDKIEKVFSEDMIVNRVPKEVIDDVIGYILVWAASVKNIPSTTPNSEAVKHAVDLLCQDYPPYLSEKEGLLKASHHFKRKSNGEYSVSFNADYLIQALKNYDSLMKEPIGVYNGPAYFLYGTESFMSVSTEKDNIKKFFPNAEFIEFPGAKHNIHPEFPHDFVSALLNHL